jgi:hypothetical protein
LKAPGFNPSTLKCDFLVSIFCCFQIQLVPLQRGAWHKELELAIVKVGLYKSNPVYPELERA